MGTLHFLAVGDTHDENIGDTVELDLKTVPRLFEASAGAAGMGFHAGIASGDRFRVGAIRSQVANLRVGHDDAVVYYYSGHGARSASKADAWPVMALGGDGFGGYDAFDLAWVYATLREKRPRMLLVAVDCCQQEVPDGILNELAFTKGLRSPAQPGPARALFAEFQGEVLAMSCRPGELSSCSPAEGGFFTSRFVSAIAGALQGRHAPSWDAILASSSNIDESQNPIWKVVGTRGAGASPPGLEPFPGQWRCLAGSRAIVRRPSAAPGMRGGAARLGVARPPRAMGVQRRGLPGATPMANAKAAPPAGARDRTKAPFCTSCGAPLRANVKFCPQCGNARR